MMGGSPSVLFYRRVDRWKRPKWQKAAFRLNGFWFLSCQTPQDSQRVATFVRRNWSALLHGFYGIAIGRQRADYFVVSQSAQNRVTAKGISFKLESMLHVGKQVLFSLRQFRQGVRGFLLRHSLARPFLYSGTISSKRANSAHHPASNCSALTLSVP